MSVTEYDEKLKRFEEKNSEVEFFKDIKNLKDWAKKANKVDIVVKCDYELRLMSLSPRNPLVVDSDQPLLVDYVTNSEVDSDSIDGNLLDYYGRRVSDSKILDLKYLYANFLYDYSNKDFGMKKYNAAQFILECVKSFLEDRDSSPQEKEAFLGRDLQVSMRTNNLDDEKWLLENICQKIYDEKYNIVNLMMYLELLSKARSPVKVSDSQNKKIGSIIDNKMHNEKVNKNYQEFRNACEAKLIQVNMQNQIEERQDLEILIGDSYVEEANNATQNSIKVMKLELALEYFKRIGVSGKMVASRILCK